VVGAAAEVGGGGGAVTVIVFVARALSLVPSMMRTSTVQSPGRSGVAVAVVVAAGLLISNPGTPSRFHSMLVIRVSAGVGVAVNVTGVPATTGVGVQVKSTVGGAASATPVPSGDTTAASVAKQAVTRSLRWLICIPGNQRGPPEAACVMRKKF
jgi:hypothetical protein